MITFKEFLAEARMAPLYHATSIYRANKVLEDDLLKVGSHNELIGDRAISLTRSFSFAVGWLKEQYSFGDGVIFELDQQKLSQNYKITPFNYFAKYNDKARISALSYKLSSVHHKNDFLFDNQYEESVGKNITNFNRYITKVMIYDKKALQKYSKTLRVAEHPLLYSWKDKKFLNK